MNQKPISYFFTESKCLASHVCLSSLLHKIWITSKNEKRESFIHSFHYITKNVKIQTFTHFLKTERWVNQKKMKECKEWNFTYFPKDREKKWTKIQWSIWKLKRLIDPCETEIKRRRKRERFCRFIKLTFLSQKGTNF